MEGSKIRTGRWSLLSGLCACLPILFLAACNSLLDVDLPGQLTDGALDDPDLAPTLAISVQGAFNCAFANYVDRGGVWSDEQKSPPLGSGETVLSSRLPNIVIYGNDDCTSDYMGWWYSFQHTRYLAETAIGRMEAYATPVANQELLLATVQVYGAYAYQLLSESFCELTFDGGYFRNDIKTPAEVHAMAEALFTSGFDNASLVTTGTTAAEARSIRNMALVGRARARLFLADTAGVLADAALVDQGFVRNSIHSAANNRLYNWAAERRNLRRSYVHPSFRSLTVNGVPDPRVPVSYNGMDQTGVPLWLQDRHRNRADPITVASWREARLMIAEMDPTQSVAIINQLRANSTGVLAGVSAAAWPLPAFDATGLTAAQIRAQVLEERRREMFLTGHRIGDKLRLGEPWDGQPGSPWPAVDEVGQPYGSLTCIPLPNQEKGI